MTVTETEIRKGLAGVYADTTAISMVNPQTNSLTYRGYPVQDLCRRCTFEEVAYLLWHGELPTRDQLAVQNRAERAQRALDPVIAATLAGLPLTAHPMDTLRTAVSLLGAADPAENDNSPAANQAKALRLFAVLPAVVALDQRRRHGLGAFTPRDDLGFAANFLYMTFGKVPEPQIVAAFQTSLILYAEHSFNASTFTARVVTSTLSDIYSAVTAAIGALKGPLHGGANEAVMHMLEEIAIPDNAKPWLDDALADGRKIMGFGHRVYKNGDSRVPAMRAPRHDRRAPRRAEPARHIRNPRHSHVRGQGPAPQPRLPRRPRLPPYRLRYPDVHADLRRRPAARLDRPHRRAVRWQQPHPPPSRLRRPHRTQPGEVRELRCSAPSCDRKFTALQSPAAT